MERLRESLVLGGRQQMELPLTPEIEEPLPLLQDDSGEQESGHSVEGTYEREHRVRATE
jgi:hypothetical protein